MSKFTIKSSVVVRGDSSSFYWKHPVLLTSAEMKCAKHHLMF